MVDLLKCFFYGLFGLLLSGCASEPWKPDFGRWYTFDPLREETNLPQSGTLWVKTCDKGNDGLLRGKGPKSFGAVREYWLRAWKNTRCNHKAAALEFPETLTQCHRENFLPCRDTLWIAGVQNNAALENIDALARPGVMLEHASVRKLPTDFPCYHKKKGFDFLPFDRLQNTFLNAGTPVYLSHYSKDRAWVMIEDVAGRELGFVKSTQVAVVDARAMKKVMSLPVAVLSKENHPLYSTSGAFLGYSRLGQILFVQKQEGPDLWVLWPRARILGSPDGSVHWERVRISRTMAHTAPLALGEGSLAPILDQLLGKNYGWGGTLGNRDCSSMVQDYFLILGYALPRNSKDQRNNAGDIISLAGKTREEKEGLIRQRGVPYKTLIYLPGHIALYIGTLRGKVCLAHAIGGIKFVKNGYEGSHLVGKSMITTLHMDAFTKGVETPFVDKITAMIVVSPSEAPVGLR